jgi:hypothetical protein
VFIVSMRLRPGDGLVDVTLPYSPGSLSSRLSNQDFDMLDPRPFSNGQEKSRCYALGEKELKFLAKMFFEFDRNGTDRLPRIRDVGRVRAPARS